MGPGDNLLQAYQLAEDDGFPQPVFLRGLPVRAMQAVLLDDFMDGELHTLELRFDVGSYVDLYGTMSDVLNRLRDQLFRNAVDTPVGLSVRDERGERTIPINGREDRVPLNEWRLAELIQAIFTGNYNAQESMIERYQQLTFIFTFRNEARVRAYGMGKSIRGALDWQLWPSTPVERGNCLAFSLAMHIAGVPEGLFDAGFKKNELRAWVKERPRVKEVFDNVFRELQLLFEPLLTVQGVPIDSAIQLFNTRYPQYTIVLIRENDRSRPRWSSAINDTHYPPLPDSEDRRVFLERSVESLRPPHIIYLAHDTALEHVALLVSPLAFAKEKTKTVRHFCYFCHKAHDEYVCKPAREIYKYWCFNCRRPLKSVDMLRAHTAVKVGSACNLLHSNKKCSLHGMFEECVEFHAKRCNLNVKTERSRAAKVISKATTEAAPPPLSARHCYKCGAFIPFSEEHFECGIKFPRKVDSTLRKTAEYWAIDMESMLEPVRQRFGTFNEEYMKDVCKHVPNMICCVKIFPKPAAFQEREKFLCETLDQFRGWLEERTERQKIDMFFYAHNLRGYDGRILFSYIVSQTYQLIVSDPPIMRGTKIISFTLGYDGQRKRKAATFIDSNLHFPTSLENLVKQFGLVELVGEKQFFPYRFNCAANQSYVGPFPELKWYDCDLMPAKKRAVFEVWHAEKLASDAVFDLQQVLKDYCFSDTNILAAAMELYHEQMYAMNNITPMHVKTLPSYAMRVWSQNYYNKIANKQPIMQLTSEHFQKIAYYGGRTNVVCRGLNADGLLTDEQLARGVRIRYYDVNSLYPAVMTQCNFPYGMPDEYDFEKLEKYPSQEGLLEQRFFGWITCDLLPPRHTFLWHPPVMTKSSVGKLEATLEPLFDVNLTSMEFYRALECGYTVGRVSWILNFRDTPDFFRDYVANFYALKQDPGKKQFAKLLLNSLYGKFGEKPDKDKMVLKRCYSEEEVAAFEQKIAAKSDQQVLVRPRNFHRGDSELYYARVRPDMSDKLLTKTNKGIAAMVTAHARLVLHKMLHMLGPQVLYYDTDSVIFLDDPACSEYAIDPALIHPSTLGLWKDEVDERGVGDKFIDGFVGLLPKTYAYRKLVRCDAPTASLEGFRRVGQSWYRVEEDIKAKGIVQNSFNQKLLHFKSYVSLAKQDIAEIACRQLQMTYEGLGGDMHSYTAVKNLVVRESEYKGDLVYTADNPLGLVLPRGWEWTAITALPSQLRIIAETKRATAVCTDSEFLSRLEDWKSKFACVHRWQ
jgi:hypothetical protein